MSKSKDQVYGSYGSIADYISFIAVFLAIFYITIQAGSSHKQSTKVNESIWEKLFIKDQPGVFGAADVEPKESKNFDFSGIFSVVNGLIAETQDSTTNVPILEQKPKEVVEEHQQSHTKNEEVYEAPKTSDDDSKNIQKDAIIDESLNAKPKSKDNTSSKSKSPFRVGSIFSYLLVNANYDYLTATEDVDYDYSSLNELYETGSKALSAAFDFMLADRQSTTNKPKTPKPTPKIMLNFDGDSKKKSPKAPNEKKSDEKSQNARYSMGSIYKYLSGDDGGNSILNDEEYQNFDIPFKELYQAGSKAVNQAFNFFLADAEIAESKPKKNSKDWLNSNSIVSDETKTSNKKVSEEPKDKVKEKVMEEVSMLNFIKNILADEDIKVEKKVFYPKSKSDRNFILRLKQLLNKGIEDADDEEEVKSYDFIQKIVSEIDTEVPEYNLNNEDAPLDISNLLKNAFSVTQLLEFSWSALKDNFLAEGSKFSSSNFKKKSSKYLNDNIDLELNEGEIFKSISGFFKHLYSYTNFDDYLADRHPGHLNKQSKFGINEQILSSAFAQVMNQKNFDSAKESFLSLLAGHTQSPKISKQKVQNFFSTWKQSSPSAPKHIKSFLNTMINDSPYKLKFDYQNYTDDFSIWESLKSFLADDNPNISKKKKVPQSAKRKSEEMLLEKRQTGIKMKCESIKGVDETWTSFCEKNCPLGNCPSEVCTCIKPKKQEKLICHDNRYVNLKGENFPCQASCNVAPFNCPIEECECKNSGMETSKRCSSPRHCKSNSYRAIPGTLATNQFCRTSCDNDSASNYCPCTLCECE